ncbi:hypothetical protein ACVWYQ_000211 [Bradyrhizobium sp. USDA 3397]
MLGVLSLILWALLIVVTAKYVLLLLRADNNGEGGTLSLMALGQRALGRRSWVLLALGVIGASMFIGDSMITPAISVLSAVEGLKLATPALKPYVVPVTVLILVLLFAVQSKGTALVASAFGPVMVTWFTVIAIMGAVHIADDPTVLAAINPYYAVQFVLSHGVIGLVTLGAVFLAVTGGEALYADLGHFGRKPIQSAWMFFVLPALLINYFGQGALVLSDPSAIEHSFYRMVPETLVLPLVGLATAATVIASQAVITGAYSLVHQAVQLGLLPRFEVRYTSESHAGQIYLPRVNRLLLIGVMLLVLLFHTPSNLASAYGICGLNHHGRRWHHGIRRDLEAVELARGYRRSPDRAFGHRRFELLQRQPAQAARWRLGAAPVRRRHGRDDLDLAQGLGDPDPEDAPDRGAAGRPDPQPGEAAAAHRQGHRGIPDQRSRLRANRAPAQSQAQQGAARAQRDTDHRDRADAPGRSVGAVQDGEDQRQVLQGPLALRLHGAAERAQGPRHRTQAGLAVRHHVDLVFRLAQVTEGLGTVGHAALAGSCVHRAEPVGQ